MTLASLVAAHGYWVLAAGSLLEGETVLLLAGFAAHRGLLDPWRVLGVAAAAGFVGDQFWFWLGRRHGPRLLARWPALARQSGRVQRLVLRWDAALVVGIRFAYGLRIAGPVLIGMSPVPAARFVLFNAVGACAWAFVVGGAGWLFGHAAEALLGRLAGLEVALFVALALVGLALWALRRARRR
jgi:membrane protein DedA with SNARE-associated domain